MPPIFTARWVGNQLKMVGRIANFRASLGFGYSSTALVTAAASEPARADHYKQSPPLAGHLAKVPTMQPTESLVSHPVSIVKSPVCEHAGSAHRIEPKPAALLFLSWTADHGLAREWTVDEIWFLAEQDFAPAHGFILPARRVFLGALQRQPGVSVTYDRRVYNRDGRIKHKTTFYRLPTCDSASEALMLSTRTRLAA